ncbi:family 43 glycosylhydrolase [Paenibacillus sp. NFR01]|uniref:family 43 glycosylhydrolase n=1 Tax=Paenibacillus sp. NFR01 TaxID=1566279 RepID=UPI0008ADC318|nr:family 43 glycosylhydrolase [Paenibacillus sp. NFR01]SEU19176.1 Glycosyl hydrolases family 43 [Paenibacillus sp. NFR01]
MNNASYAHQHRKTTSLNPAITSIYTADPSAHVWEDGRVYIYASHDTDPARGCDLMDRYHVFSSPDMVNWRDEGEILSSDDVAWGRPEGGFMWAPDCAYRNGTYYFYYPHPSGTDWNATWKIGVATSGKPASGFQDQGYIGGLGGFAMIDPAVFVDDDNRAYLYYGGGGRCEGGELAEDMMSVKGTMREMEGLEDFHEAAWVFKRNDVYYLTYADNLEGNNRMRYATSRSPLGPWTSRGIFLEPTGCSTTHGSVTEFKGKWYLFYHNQAVSGEGTLRSVCIDELDFAEDGAILTVTQTKEGVKAVGGTTEAIPPADVYAAADGVLGNGAALRMLPDGTGTVAGLEAPGAFCRFNGVDGGAGGRGELRVRYATAERLAKLRLQVNGKDYSLVNALSTGGEERFTGITGLTVTLDPGRGNTVSWTGGHGGIAIHSMEVRLLPD